MYLAYNSLCDVLLTRLSHAWEMDKMSQFQFLNKCTIPFYSAVSAWKQEISSTVTTTRPLLRTAHALPGG